MKKTRNKQINVDETETLKGGVSVDQSKSPPESRDDFDDLDRGWAWVVLFAAFSALINSGGVAYTTGIVHSVVLEKFQQNVALTAWVGSLHSAVVSAGGPLSSMIIDRYGCRTAIASSGFVSAIGYIGTAFAPTLEVTIVTFGVIGGLGGALCYTAGSVVIGFNFKKRRSIALGVAISGVGMGIFVIAPLMQFSRDYYGFSGFFIILAAATINNITFGMLCFPSKLEKDARKRRQLDSYHHGKKASSSTSALCDSVRKYGRVIFNKAVVCLEVAMFTYLFGIFIIYLYIPTYVETKGSSQAVSAMLVSLSGITTVIGRLAVGVISNYGYIADVWLYSGCMCMVAIATLLFPHFAHLYVGQVVYIVILGTFSGTCYVLAPNINIAYVGVEYMAAAGGFELFFGGIGSVLGPVISGLMIDSGGSYDQTFYIAGCFILLACISSGISQCFATKDSEAKSDSLEIDVMVEISELSQEKAELKQSV